MKYIKTFENYQLAQKTYKGIIPDDVLDNISKICANKNYIKLMVDMYNIYKRYISIDIYDKIQNLYDIISNYNKNILPIPNFDINNTNKQITPTVIEDYGHCINIIKKLPSLIKRNLKEIREPYNKYIGGKIQYLDMLLQRISNKEKTTYDLLIRKACASSRSITDMIDFFEDKSNLIEENYFTKDKIDEILNDENDDTDISWCAVKIYDINKKYVIKIDDVAGLHRLGTNSLWCFTYGKNNTSEYEQYSYNGIVYLLVDFNLKPSDKQYMCVVINPDFKNETCVFNQINEPLGEFNNNNTNEKAQMKYLLKFFDTRDISHVSDILDFGK